MNIKETRIKAGLTQQMMSEILEIPKRTIQSWELEERDCPKWAKKMVIKALEGIKEGRMLFTDWTIERLSIEANKYPNKDEFVNAFLNEPWTEEFSKEKVRKILSSIFEEKFKNSIDERKNK